MRVPKEDAIPRPAWSSLVPPVSFFLSDVDNFTSLESGSIITNFPFLAVNLKLPAMFFPNSSTLGEDPYIFEFVEKIPEKLFGALGIPFKYSVSKFFN